MATAIEMTIALGRTLYGASQCNIDSDDTIENGTIENEAFEGCETRVSVTWRLNESEQNLALTASLLAEKTVQVLETADRTVRCTEGQPGASKIVASPNLPAALPASAPPSNGMTSPDSAASANGNGTTGNRMSGDGAASRTYTTAYVPRITKAQSLAIQSLCTRHGLADWELRRLVWEQFARKEQGELTKEQAGELLNILQQNTGHEGASNPAYA